MLFSINQKIDLKRQQERVKWIACGIDYDKLTEWEDKFVESVETQSDNGKFLTEKQWEILERIYKEKGK